MHAGKAGALDGNEFQDEIVLGTNEYTKHLVWVNGWKHILGQYVLGKVTKIDGGKEVS